MFGHRFDPEGANDALRWRMNDGRTGSLTRGATGWQSTLGWTGKDDGHEISLDECGALTFDGVPGRAIELSTTDVQFMSGDVPLAGRLILPPGAHRVPVVVLVHGSEDSSARQYFALQRQFPLQGTGAFVYDKRGTGGSRGVFTHDYHLLAADAAAAVREARRLAGKRAGRVGLQGGSQGGWVAPLAATLEPVDFVIAAYGLAVSPLDEDRECIALDMARHGFGPQETAKALEVGAAAAVIVRSGFRDGYQELELLRTRYSDEPWFRYLRGNATGILLSQSEAFWRERGPVLFAGILPDYDPMPVLRKLGTPQLWVLGADDIDAPIGETMNRLRGLRREGRPISIVIYPRAEHGMFEYQLDESGERVSTRLPESYLTLMSEFASSGKIGARYGDTIVYR